MNYSPTCIAFSTITKYIVRSALIPSTPPEAAYSYADESSQGTDPAAMPVKKKKPSISLQKARKRS